MTTASPPVRAVELDREIESELVQHLVRQAPTGFATGILTVAAVLLVLYCADQVYSAQHPNVGAGITDYKGSDTSLEAPTPYEIRKRSDGLS